MLYPAELQGLKRRLVEPRRIELPTFALRIQISLHGSLLFNKLAHHAPR